MPLAVEGKVAWVNNTMISDGSSWLVMYMFLVAERTVLVDAVAPVVALVVVVMR